MRIFFRLFRILLTYKSWMILASFMGFLTIGSSIGLLMTSAYIIAKAALHPSIADLQIGIVGVRFFGISRGIFRYLERYFSHESTFRILSQLRVWFYKAIEPLAPAKLSGYKSGDLLSRIISDIDLLQHVFIRVVSPIVVTVLISSLMFFLLNIFDFIFSIILIISFLIGGIGVPLFIHFLNKTIGKEMINLRSELQILTIDSVQGMAEILAFGQGKNFTKKFQILNKRYEVLQKKSLLIKGLHESLIGLIMNVTVVLLLYIAIPKVSQSLLSGVYLSVLVLGIMAAFEAITPLPLAAQHLGESLNAGERLFEIIDSKPNVIDDVSISTELKNYSLKIDNLSFRYNADENLVLKDINIEIPERSKVAIVGASGSGKSTLVNLLLRFWNYETGNIYLGNYELHKLKQEDVRKYISVISQNSYLFNDTILVNLALAAENEDKIKDVAQQVEIHNFIQALPEKYNTCIGEHGNLLSGGERQRLAITRAFLKETPIIILDEPSAHLDSVTELKILNSIWKNTKDKTVILITHRLVGLENVDEIIVMQKGKIIERGRHQELIATKTIYSQMLNIQNQYIAVEKIS